MLIMGDFNVVFDGSMDTSQRTTAEITFFFLAYIVTLKLIFGEIGIKPKGILCF